MAKKFKIKFKNLSKLPPKVKEIEKPEVSKISSGTSKVSFGTNLLALIKNEKLQKYFWFLILFVLVFLAGMRLQYHLTPVPSVLEPSKANRLTDNNALIVADKPNNQQFNGKLTVIGPQLMEMRDKDGSYKKLQIVEHSSFVGPDNKPLKQADLKLGQVVVVIALPTDTDVFNIERLRVLGVN